MTFDPCPNHSITTSSLLMKGDCFQTELLLIGGGIEHTLCTLLWCEDQLTLGDASNKHAHYCSQCRTYLPTLLSHVLSLPLFSLCTYLCLVVVFLLSVCWMSHLILPCHNTLLHLHSLNAVVLLECKDLNRTTQTTNRYSSNVYN